jgi:division protein CdvB (Snf7/Vps24/ESCRT-III family)
MKEKFPELPAGVAERLGAGAFVKKWDQQAGVGWAERIREAVRPAGPLKPRLEQAIRAIQVQITKLDATANKLKERDTAIFNKVVSALQKHDTAHASVYANELAEVRKIARLVTQAKMALEQISLRLSTVQELGEIVVTLAPAMGVIRGVKNGLVQVLPEAEKELGDISSLLSSILVDAGQMAGTTLNFEASSEEAERILGEAAAIAEQRMKEKFPELPAGVAERLGAGA